MPAIIDDEYNCKVLLNQIGRNDNYLNDVIIINSKSNSDSKKFNLVYFGGDIQVINQMPLGFLLSLI
jgi:hypothetical protein